MGLFVSLYYPKHGNDTDSTRNRIETKSRVLREQVEGILNYGKIVFHGRLCREFLIGCKDTTNFAYMQAVGDFLGRIE